MTLAPIDPASPDLSGLVADHDDVTLTGDPGAELVDLPDDLALPPTIPDDQLETLSAAPAAFLSVAASDAAAWTEYEWASWMAGVLRAAGVPVIEYPGWATRGRPRSVGRFQPRGVMWHHDASPVGPSPYVAKFCAEIGRPAEGIPAPLSQLWVCDGCNAHTVGTWHVLAAGRANHAGTGSWGAVGTDQGNSVLIGVETDHTTGEAWPPALYASLVAGTAALMKHMRSDPAKLLVGHKEYAPHRKNDPDPMNMDTGRADVAAGMLGQPPAPVQHKYVRYLVQQGDTLIGVAAKYHCSPESLYAWNAPTIEKAAADHFRHLHGNDTVIWPGTVLTIYIDFPGQHGVPLG